MPYGKAPEAEEPYGGGPRHNEHKCCERIDADNTQRRIEDAEEKKRVRIAEYPVLRKKEDRIGPVHRAGKDMAPMFDQGERKIAVLLIAECAVEAGEQPTAKHQRKTGCEQGHRDPAIRMIERLSQKW